MEVYLEEVSRRREDREREGAVEGRGPWEWGERRGVRGGVRRTLKDLALEMESLEGAVRGGWGTGWDGLGLGDCCSCSVFCCWF